MSEPQQLTQSQEEEEEEYMEDEEINSQEEASMDSDSEVDESTEVSPMVDKKKIYTKDYRLHEIKISTVDRFCKIVDPPESHVLSNEEFYNTDGFPDIDLIKEHLRKEGRIQLTHLMKLIHDVHDIFCAEDNVLMVEAPLTVCGDIHGQYYDLLKLFEVGGDPKSTQYLFLGDYVDRGYFSIECLILLFCYKLVFPNNFWLIRGNHECRHLTDYFTFKEECEYKYDISVYEAVMDTFDALPLAAIMNKQFYCVHGGLSPQIQSIEQLNNIDRFTEPPSSGPMCDLLWADPMEDFTGDDMFEFNAVRGCSFNFGYGAVCKFLEQNKLLSVIRAHEAQDAGYRMYRRNEKSGFPSVITLFSAPNYLGTYNNKGAVLRYENNVINIRQFNHSPHPYYLPGFMNVFAWSLPFVGDKLVEIILTILKLVDDSEAEKVEAVTEAKAADKRRVLHSKIRGVTKMLAILHKMRKVRAEEVRAGLLSPKDIKPSISQASFETAKELDRINEARPSSPRSGDLRSSGSSDLRSSTDGLQRRISRDNILFAKKNSIERLNLAELLKDAPQVPPQIKEEPIPQPPPPQIKEDPVDQPPPPQIKEEGVLEIKQNPV